jgi:hypothetical protein
MIINVKKFANSNPNLYIEVYFIKKRTKIEENILFLLII